MDAILTAQEERFRDRLREFVEAEILPQSAKLDESVEVPWHILRRLAEESVIGIVVPREYGGVNATLQTLLVCIAREQLSRGSVNVDALFAMQGIGSYPIIVAGSEEVKRRVLPPIARGEQLAAYAVTEECSGSDIASLETTASRKGTGYVINGRKTFVSNAGVASTYVVLVKTDAEKGTKGLTAFVVDGDNPGLNIGPLTDLIAPHIVGTVEFNNCYVSDTHRLGEEGDGFRIAMETLDTYRASVGAAAVGVAQSGLEETLNYAKRCRRFGHMLVDFQATRFKIADMATQISAARLLVYQAAKLKDVSEVRATKEVSMAKLFATEMAGRIVDEALQIHGGMGLVKGQRIERLYRQVRPMRIYEGTSEIQRLIISRAVLAEGCMSHRHINE